MANFPLPKFHFQVEWGGDSINFTEASGLTVEREMLEYRHGASPEYHKTNSPGMTKYSNITLKRGSFQGDNQFYDFWNEAALTEITKRDITISLLNESHEPVVVWKVKEAWPIKVESTDLKADANEVAIESMELAHGGVTIEHV